MPENTQGGAGGEGGAGGDPSGVGGAGGQGGQGGAARRPGGEDPRSGRVTDWVVGCAAVLALAVSLVNYVQQDNLRTVQGETEASSQAVADYIAYIASQPATVERIRLHLEATTGTSLPELPPAPTTAVGG